MLPLLLLDCSCRKCCCCRGGAMAETPACRGGLSRLSTPSRIRHSLMANILHRTLYYTLQICYTCRFIFGLESKTHTGARVKCNKFFSIFLGLFFASFFIFSCFFLFHSNLAFFLFWLEGLLASVLNRLVRRLGLHLRRK